MNDKNPEFGLFRCSVGLKWPIMGFFLLVWGQKRQIWALCGQFGVRKVGIGASLVGFGAEKPKFGCLGYWVQDRKSKLEPLGSKVNERNSKFGPFWCSFRFKKMEIWVFLIRFGSEGSKLGSLCWVWGQEGPNWGLCVEFGVRKVQIGVFVMGLGSGRSKLGS